MKKFKDRNIAVERIWKAIQSLTPATSEASEPVVPEPVTPAPEAPQTPDIATVTAAPGKNASRAKKSPAPAPEVAPAEVTKSPAEAPQASDVAPESKPARKNASKADKTPTATKKPKGPRQGSKIDMILDLLKRGVTAAELMETTSWQAHSLRGFIAGTVAKKMGLAVVSTKGEDGERNYAIKA